LKKKEKKGWERKQTVANDALFFFKKREQADDWENDKMGWEKANLGKWIERAREKSNNGGG